jgi:hypothetical protein
MSVSGALQRFNVMDAMLIIRRGIGTFRTGSPSFRGSMDE